MTNLRRTARQLEQTANAIPAALQRLNEAAPGWPAATLNGPGGGGHQSGSTVERAALAHDQAVHDARRLDQLAELTAQAVNQLTSIVERWARPARHGVTADDSDAWCRSCRRAQHASPTHRNGLCHWCYDFQAAHGQFPPVDLLDAHHQGRRITQAAVDRALRLTPKP